MKSLHLGLVLLSLFVAQSAWANAEGADGGVCYGNSTCNEGLRCDTATNTCTAMQAAVGTEGGTCYGNSTCNQGLSCDAARNQCVPLPASIGAPPVPTPPQPPTPPATQGGYALHRGVMGGVGIGLGFMGCESCESSDTGLAYDFNVGGFLSPRLALMFDSSSVYLDDYDHEFLTTLCLAGQYWLRPQWWIKGGIGMSRVSGYRSNNGLGVTAAVGVEVMQRGAFAVDIAGRVNLLSAESGRSEDTETFNIFSGVVGIRWK